MSKKLYRGISEKQLEEYKRKGIPKGTNFLNKKKDAKMYGKKLISVSYGKCFEYNNESDVFNFLKMPQKYFKNKCKIKRFELENA